MRRLITERIGRRGVLTLVFLMLVAALVRSTVGKFAVVDGVSMCPTLLPNDVVQTRGTDAGWTRGSVVILKDDRGESAVKRIIGLPGETVTLYRGFVFINHRKLHEPYLARSTYTFKCSDDNEQAEAWFLREGEYFVLGDNRYKSYDSRNFGPVPQNRITRVVALPANAALPEFCGVVLTESGKIRPDRNAEPALLRGLTALRR